LSLYYEERERGVRQLDEGLTLENTTTASTTKAQRKRGRESIHKLLWYAHDRAIREPRKKARRRGLAIWHAGNLEELAGRFFERGRKTNCGPISLGRRKKEGFAEYLSSGRVD